MSCDNEGGPLAPGRLSGFSTESAYLDLSELNTINCHSLKLLHLNIRSIPANRDSLCLFLANLNVGGVEPDALLLCETFLNNKNYYLHAIPNYNLYESHRQDRRGGGVAIYVHKKFICSKIPALSVFDEGTFESIFLEIKLKNRKFILGEMYKPPNTSYTNFTDFLQTTYTLLDNYTCPKFIGTDQNIDC